MQDIWAGAAPVPYLVGADSPNERSPFAEWRVVVPTDAFAAVLAAGGYTLDGRLVEVGVEETEPGSGVWLARITSAVGGVRSGARDDAGPGAQAAGFFGVRAGALSGSPCGTLGALVGSLAGARGVAPPRFSMLAA